LLMRAGRASSPLESTTTAAYGIDLPVPLSTRSSLKCEVDYLGMINFCLRPTDTALSGSSKSKVLNAVTNEVRLGHLQASIGAQESHEHDAPFFPCPLPRTVRATSPGVPRPDDRVRPPRRGPAGAVSGLQPGARRHQLLPRARRGPRRADPAGRRRGRVWRGPARCATPCS
jgi:hypothetical protein